MPLILIKSEEHSRLVKVDELPHKVAGFFAKEGGYYTFDKGDRLVFVPYHRIRYIREENE